MVVFICLILQKIVELMMQVDEVTENGSLGSVEEKFLGNMFFVLRKNGGNINDV